MAGSQPATYHASREEAGITRQAESSPQEMLANWSFESWQLSLVHQTLSTGQVTIKGATSGLHCQHVSHRHSSKSTIDEFLASATGQILSPILVWVPQTVQIFSILQINICCVKIMKLHGKKCSVIHTPKTACYNLLLAPDLRMPAKDTATSAPILRDFKE